MKKAGFTMIELVFVIVILGILAGVAVPKLSVTRDDATNARIRADIAAIRSGIALDKSKAMMEGNISGWKKHVAGLARDNYSKVVQGGIKKGNTRNGWNSTNTTTPTACVGGKCATFELVTTEDKAGEFICKSGDCYLFE